MSSSRMRSLSALPTLFAVCAMPTLAAPGSNSAYVTDAQTSHVEDATSRGIGEVNMIACIMHAMRPDALVNEPSYIALVDKNKCDAEKQSSSANASASDGSQGAADYITAVVNSSRESNTAPMITKAWLNFAEEGAQVQISVHISATEAPSDANPYGAFRLDYCGQLEGSGPCLMNGFLEAANGGINYYDSNSGDHEQTTAMKLAVTGTGGNGRLEMHGDGGGDATFAFAYDADLFHRDIGGTEGEQCFSRDARDPGTGFSVWRYGLYDATGARVTRNSGFPIEFSANGTTYHGYLGYYGLSLPPAAQEFLHDGDTVNKVDYSNGGAPAVTPYTVMKNEGKLIKFTKRHTTLAQLDKIRFNLFVGMEGADLFAGAEANTQYEMYWDDAHQNFVVTAHIVCGMNGCETQQFAEGEQPTVSADFWLSRGGLQGWSQLLGGELFIDLHDVSGTLVSTEVQVVYRSQDIVYPGDSTLPGALYCLQNCPTQATLQAYFSSSDLSSPTSPYVGSTYNNWNPTAIGSQVAYAFNSTTAILQDGDGAAVTYTDAEQYRQRAQFAYGVTSGRLFADLTVAACKDFQNNDAYCDWKVSDAEVYYQWQTGPNSWNQFAAVKDGSGNLVTFEAPLQLSFHVPDQDAYGQYRGTNIVLQYGGFGDLWGIPGRCVSANTNEEVPCNTENSRYVPAFIIPYDQTLGVATSTDSSNQQYLVKWLDREIRFARKTVGDCANLPLPDSSVALPGTSDLKNPADPNSDIYIGNKPEVTDAPRVIHGEVKY